LGRLELAPPRRLVARGACERRARDADDGLHDGAARRLDEGERPVERGARAGARRARVGLDENAAEDVRRPALGPRGLPAATRPDGVLRVRARAGGVPSSEMRERDAGEVGALVREPRARLAGDRERTLVVGARLVPLAAFEVRKPERLVRLRARERALDRVGQLERAPGVGERRFRVAAVLVAEDLALVRPAQEL